MKTKTLKSYVPFEEFEKTYMHQLLKSNLGRITVDNLVSAIIDTLPMDDGLGDGCSFGVTILMSARNYVAGWKHDAPSSVADYFENRTLLCEVCGGYLKMANDPTSIKDCPDCGAPVEEEEPLNLPQKVVVTNHVTDENGALVAAGEIEVTLDLEPATMDTLIQELMSASPVVFVTTAMRYELPMSVIWKYADAHPGTDWTTVIAEAKEILGGK